MISQHSSRERVAGLARLPACTETGVYKVIHFATEADAEAMQRWIAESCIEIRPDPGALSGAQLPVTRGKQS